MTINIKLSFVSCSIPPSVQAMAGQSPKSNVNCICQREPSTKISTLSSFWIPQNSPLYLNPLNLYCFPLYYYFRIEKFAGLKIWSFRRQLYSPAILEHRTVFSYIILHCTVTLTNFSITDCWSYCSKTSGMSQTPYLAIYVYRLVQVRTNSKQRCSE